jgi:hypothetical protein
MRLEMKLNGSSMRLKDFNEFFITFALTENRDISDYVFATELIFRL